MTEEVNEMEQELEIDLQEVVEQPDLDTSTGQVMEEPDDAKSDELPLPEEEIEQDEAKKKDYILKRKEKQLAKAQQEKEQLEAYVLEMQQAQSRPAAIAQIANTGMQPPTRDQFDTEEEYLDARMDYRDAVKQLEFSKNRQAELGQKIQYERRQKLRDALERGAEKYTDFEEITAPIFSKGFPTNDILADAIVDSEFKIDILCFMGKNLDHAKKIALMNPIQGIKEIAKLEQRFLEKKNAKKPSSPTYKPMQTIKSGSAPKSDPSSAQLATMTQREYENWYNTKFGKKRSA